MTALETVSQNGKGWKLSEKFSMSGKTYRTDTETLEVLRQLVPPSKASGDSSAVTAVMSLGLEFGRIVEEPVLSDEDLAIIIKHAAWALDCSMPSLVDRRRQHAYTMQLVDEIIRLRSVTATA